MPSLKALREQYPGSDVLNDYELSDLFAQKEGMSRERALYEFGLPQRSQGLGGDTWRDLKSGAQQLPGALAGLVELPVTMATGARPISNVTTAIGKATGFQPGRWSEENQASKTDEYQRQAAEYQKVSDDPDAGVIDMLGTLVKNPRVALSAATQSLPGMLAGGVGGAVIRGIGTRAAVGLGEAAGGIGPTRAAAGGYLERAFGERAGSAVALGASEGALTAGSQMQGYDENLPNQQRNAFAAGGAGLLTGVIGAGITAGARRIGLETVESKIMGRSRNFGVADETADLLNRGTRPDAPRGTLARFAGSAAVEVAQEFPQSYQEQVFQNIGKGEEDITKGALGQGVLGAVSAAGMGPAANLRNQDFARENYDKAYEQRQQQFVDSGNQPPPAPQVPGNAAFEARRAQMRNDVIAAQAAAVEQERIQKIEAYVTLYSGPEFQVPVELARKQAEAIYAPPKPGVAKVALSTEQQAQADALTASMKANGATKAMIEESLRALGLSTKPVKEENLVVAAAKPPTKKELRKQELGNIATQLKAKLDALLADEVITPKQHAEDIALADANKLGKVGLRIRGYETKRAADVKTAVATKATVLPKTSEQILQDQANAAKTAETQPDQTKPASDAAAVAADTSAATTAAAPDDLYNKAVKIVRTTNRASPSLVQRQLNIRFDEAIALIEEMERNGVVSPADAGGSRTVIETTPAAATAPITETSNWYDKALNREDSPKSYTISERIAGTTEDGKKAVLIIRRNKSDGTTFDIRMTTELGTIDLGGHGSGKTPDHLRFLSNVFTPDISAQPGALTTGSATKSESTTGTSGVYTGPPIPTLGGMQNGDVSEGLRTGRNKDGKSKDVSGGKTEGSSIEASQAVSTAKGEVKAPDSDPPVSKGKKGKKDLQAWLTSELTPDETAAVTAVYGANKNKGSNEEGSNEEVIKGSLRAQASEMGISHTELRNRAKKGIAKIELAAQKAGFDLEAAKDVLGMQSQSDILDTAGTGLMANQYTGEGNPADASAANDELDPEAGVFREGDTVAEGDSNRKANAGTDVESQLDAAVTEGSLDGGNNDTKAGIPVDADGMPTNEEDLAFILSTWNKDNPIISLPERLVKPYVQLYLGVKAGDVNERQAKETYNDILEQIKRNKGAAGSETVERGGVSQTLPSNESKSSAVATTSRSAPKKVTAKTATVAAAWDAHATTETLPKWDTLTDSQRYHLESVVGDSVAESKAVVAVTNELKKEAAAPAQVSQGTTIEGEFTVLSDEQVAQATNLLPNMAAAVDDALSTEEKQQAADHYDTGEYNNKTRKDFLRDYAKWLASSGKMFHALSDLFLKVFNKAVAGIMAVAIAVNINLATPVPNAQASIPVNTFTIKQSVERPKADFKGVEASRDVRLVADWQMRQKHNKSFIIGDKTGGLIYAFDSKGVLLAKAPSLYGAAGKDKLTQGSINRTEAQKTKEDKITPAGVFAGKAEPNWYGKTGIAFDSTRDRVGPNATEYMTIGIHIVYLGTPSENRQGRLDSASPLDNRISYGCINVPPSFINVIDAHFSADSVVIVLPELQSAESFFPMMDKGNTTSTITYTTNPTSESAQNVSWGTDKLSGLPIGGRKGSRSASAADRRNNPLSNGSRIIVDGVEREVDGVRDKTFGQEINYRLDDGALSPWVSASSVERAGVGPDNLKFSISDLRKLPKVSDRGFAESVNALRRKDESPYIVQETKTSDDINKIASEVLLDVLAFPERYAVQVKNLTADRYFLDETTGEKVDITDPNQHWRLSDLGRQLARMSPESLKTALQQEAEQTTKQRQEALQSLATYLINNPELYFRTEAARIVLLASKLSYIETKEGVQIVQLANNNRHVMTVSGELASRINEKLNDGLSIKEALKKAVEENTAAQKKSNDRQGWVKYSQSEKYENAADLSQAVCGTGWCTGNTTTAQGQLSKGDFWVYFDNGKPEIALRTEGGSLTAADPPRGTLPGQRLSPEYQEIADKFLKTTTEVKGGEAYLKARDAMKAFRVYKTTGDIAPLREHLTYNIINNKISHAKFVEPDELSGYGKPKEYSVDDPEYVGKPVPKRVPFSVNLYDTTTNLEFVGGNLMADLINFTSAPMLKGVGGDFEAASLINAPMLESVGGDLLVFKLTSAPMLKGVGGNFEAANLTSAPMLETVEGDLYARNLTSVPMLKTVGSSLNADSLPSAPMLENVEGPLYAGNLTSAPMLRVVEGRLSADNLTSAPMLETVGGSLSANSLTSVPMLETVDGDLYANSLTSVPMLKTVGWDLQAGNLTSAPMLETVGGSLHAGSLTSAPILKSVGSRLSGGTLRAGSLTSAPMLESVGSGLYAENLTSAPMLKTVGRSLYVENLTSAPMLETVGENLNAGNLTSAPMLRVVEGDLTARNLTSAPMLENVEGDLRAPNLTNAPMLESAGRGLSRNKFSKNAGGDPSNAKLIRDALKGFFFSGARFDRLVTVVNTVDELPEDIKKSVGVDSTTQAITQVKNGKTHVYMITGNIKSGEELAVFLHEVGVHVGMKNLIGAANFNKLVAQVKQWAKNKTGQQAELAQKALARVEAANTKDVDKDEELLAYFVEEAVNAGVDPTALHLISGPMRQWFSTLWASVKSALRKIGFDRFDKLTALDVVNLAYGAARMELQGNYHGTAANFRNFLVKFVGTGEGAQAFGWGSTYIAQSKDLGQEYQRKVVFEKAISNVTKVLNKLTGQALSAPIIDPVTSEEMHPAGTVITADLRHLFEIGFSNIDNVAKSIVIGSIDYIEVGGKRILVNSAMPEGALMRVDTATQDEELLNLDEAVPKNQLKQIMDGLLERFKGTRTEAYVRQLAESLDIETTPITGAGIYRAIMVLFGAKPGPKLGNTKYAKPTSEFLDSIGIKGNIFLDRDSRDKARPRTVDIKVLAALVENAPTYMLNGKRVTISRGGFATVKASGLFVRVIGQDAFGRSNDEQTVHIDELTTLDGEELLTKQQALDAIFEIKNYKNPNPTSNVVIFNEKTVQRIATQIGNSPDSIKFSKSVREQASRIAGSAGEKIVDDTTYTLKNMASGLMYLHDLVSEFEGRIESVRPWYKAMQDSFATRKIIEQQAEKIADAANNLKNGTGAVNDFLGKSTYEQKWGYDHKGQKADPVMAAAFNRLTKPEQDIVKQVFDHNELMLARKQAVLKKLGLEKVLNTGGSKLSGPYAPLKRFGGFVGQLKSKELAEAEAAQQPDKKKIAELRSNPNHHVLSFFDTIGQAKQFAQANEGKWVWTDAYPKMERPDAGTKMNYAVLQRVLSAVKMSDSDVIPAEAKAAMTKMVQDLYFQTLDEHNARTSGLRRMNIAGFDQDMIRSFLHHARAEAGFIANMEHGGDINDNFTRMARETADKSTGKRVSAEEFNTLAKHYASNMQTEETPIQDGITTMTSAWQLATSPGYHLTNATQAIMSTLPRLAADFNNYTGAWTALTNGYKLLKYTGVWGTVKINNVKDKGLRDTLQRIADLNLLDIGMTEDLGTFDAIKTGYSTVDKASSKARAALQLLRKVSRSVEVANRVASASAGYTMARAAGKSEQAAQDYAIDLVRSTQSDMSRNNAPLLLKRLPKPMVQYRKYQFTMAALYANAFRQAFLSSDSTTRAIGRRMLKYKLFHTSVAAGVLGWPMMNIAAIVFAMLAGGDDEPADLERTLREAIGDEDLANLILHGPGAALGLDMSAKLGDDKVFSIMPYTDFDVSSASGLAKTVAGAVGPAFGQLGKFADGFGAMSRGDYIKGIEKFMPKGAESVMKAFRIANEGYTLKNGDVMFTPDDISGLSLAMDALGMPSTELKRMDWLRSQQYEIKRFYTDRTKEIQRDYYVASKEGDTDKMSDLREDWSNLQEGKDNLRQYFGDRHDELKRQPLANLLKYPATAAKRERKLQLGAGAGQ